MSTSPESRPRPLLNASEGVGSPDYVEVLARFHQAVGFGKYIHGVGAVETHVVAATNNDAEDALSVLTARQLNPEVRVVAAATDIENIGKLKRAGADTVISPAGMAGHLLVESALRGSDAEKVAERILDEESVDGGEGDGRGSTDDGS